MITTTRLAKALLDPLMQLGDTPGKIAIALRHRRIRGYKGDMTSCPLAEYLKTIYPSMCIMVGVKRISINGLVVSPIPKRLQQFIEFFDEGKYPFLDNNPDTNAH